MPEGVPQLLPHASKPSRPRGLVRHSAPASFIRRRDGKATVLRKPILISIIFHLALVSTTVAFFIKERHVRIPLDQGKGGIVLVLQSGKTVPSKASEPTPPTPPPPVEPPPVSKPVETPAPVAEALPVLPPKPVPQLEPIAVSLQPSPVPVVSKPVVNKAQRTASTQAAAAARGVRTASHRDTIYNPDPVYPEDAREAGRQGTVSLGITISAQGTVEDVAVDRSSGCPSLDRAAVSTVRRWRFARDESACVIHQPIRFHLDAGAEE